MTLGTTPCVGRTRRTWLSSITNSSMDAICAGSVSSIKHLTNFALVLQRSLTAVSVRLNRHSPKSFLLLSTLEAQKLILAQRERLRPSLKKRRACADTHLLLQMVWLYSAHPPMLTNCSGAAQRRRMHDQSWHE